MQNALIQGDSQTEKARIRFDSQRCDPVSAGIGLIAGKVIDVPFRHTPEARFGNIPHTGIRFAKFDSQEPI